MKKQIATIIVGIILVSFASAMYSGDCIEVDLSELESLDNVVYDIVGNSSNLEGLTINLDGTMASICTTTNYEPDSFTIIFIDNSTKEIVKEVHHYSSGSSGTTVIYKNRTKYVDRVEYVQNNTKEIEKEIVKEIEIKETPIWFVIFTIAILIFIVYLFVIFTIAILIFIVYLIKWLISIQRRFKKKQEDKE